VIRLANWSIGLGGTLCVVSHRVRQSIALVTPTNEKERMRIR